MHELAIVSDMMDLCAQHAKQHNATSVDTITISIGKLSGVEAHYVRECFECFRQGIFANTTLECIQTDVIVRCAVCGDGAIDDIRDICCAKCGSYDVMMISGDELILQKIQMH